MLECCNFKPSFKLLIEYEFEPCFKLLIEYHYQIQLQSLGFHLGKTGKFMIIKRI